MATRCDSCIAAAKYKAYFKTGVLFFCQHHYRRHQDALVDAALRVISIKG